MCPDGPVGPQGPGVATRFTFFVVHSTLFFFLQPKYRYRYKYSSGPPSAQGSHPISPSSYTQHSTSSPEQTFECDPCEKKFGCKDDLNNRTNTMDPYEALRAV